MQSITRAAAERPARAAQHAPPSRPRIRVARASYSSGGNDPSSTPQDAAPAVGSRVEPWLSSPLGALAFGPRAALGALLTLPSRLGALPADVQRVTELLADPRPLGDKQAVVAAEVESRLVAALEAGARVEQEALGAVAAVLPADAARAVDELLLRPLRPPVSSSGRAYNNNNTTSSSAYSPDWMTSTDEATSTSTSGSGAWSSDSSAPPSRYQQLYGAANAAKQPPAVTYTADMVATRMVASELAGVRSAVGGVKSALEGLRAGSGGPDAGSRQAVLRLNVREARDVLAARLEEVGPPPQDAATLAAAVREARTLLAEVDGQFGF